MARIVHHTGPDRHVECDGDIHRAKVAGQPDDLQCLCFCDDPRFLSGGYTEDLFREYHDALRRRLGMPPKFVTRELTPAERHRYPDQELADGRRVQAYVDNGFIAWRQATS